MTFAIDAEAEAFLAGGSPRNAPQVAFYSEDRGMVAPGRASRIRADRRPDRRDAAGAGRARGGLHGVALAPLGEGEPTMGDVVGPARRRDQERRWFVAVRGEGCRASRPIALSENTDLERLFWVYGLRAAPPAPTVEVIGELIDRSSLGGATSTSARLPTT